MQKVLGKDFFQRPALTVAKELIGKYLVVQQGKKIAAHMIVETEAYVGPHDKASHSHKGRTPRTEVMFRRGGVWYVYFTYGMHWMLNIVTNKKEYAAAVLIRGVEGFSGPARLTKALGIDKRFNGLPANKKTGLWVEDRGVVIKKSLIQKTPRIGIAYAGEYALKPWRFVIKK